MPAAKAITLSDEVRSATRAAVEISLHYAPYYPSGAVARASMPVAWTAF